MGVTSQVTDRGRFIRETDKGDVVGKKMYGILTGHSVEPFVAHLGQVREMLKHHDIPSVPMGLMGDIPCFRVGLTCTPLQSIKD